MRYLYGWILLAVLGLAIFTSCEKEDETWMNSTSGRVWKPEVELLVTSATSVKLQWSQPQYTSGLMDILPDIDPEQFHIYRSRQLDNGYEELAGIENKEGNYTFSLSGLQQDTPYYFYITASRKGLEVTSSDTLMVIPGTAPESETLFTKTDVRQIAFSSQLNKLAYVDPFYKYETENVPYSVTALLMSDLDGSNTEILAVNGTYPCWSNTGETLYFTYYNENPTAGQGEEQLAGLAIASQTITLLTGDEFSRWGSKLQPGGTLLAYQALLQEAENNNYLLKLAMLDLETLTEQEVVDESFFYLRSVNKLAWRDQDRILFDCLTAYDDYRIYQTDINTGTTTLLLPEEWNGMAPSVSPGGNYMAFVANRTGSSQIWLYNFDTASFRMLTGYTDTEYIIPGTTTIEWYDDHSILFVLNEEKVTRLKVK